MLGHIIKDLFQLLYGQISFRIKFHRFNRMIEYILQNILKDLFQSSYFNCYTVKYHVNIKIKELTELSGFTCPTVKFHVKMKFQ